MTNNNYYIRYEDNGTWQNAVRDQQKFFDRETAEDIYSKIQAAGHRVTMFELQGQGIKPKIVKDTGYGVEW